MTIFTIRLFNFEQEFLDSSSSTPEEQKKINWDLINNYFYFRDSCIPVNKDHYFRKIQTDFLNVAKIHPNLFHSFNENKKMLLLLAARISVWFALKSFTNNKLLFDLNLRKWPAITELLFNYIDHAIFIKSLDNEIFGYDFNQNAKKRFSLFGLFITDVYRSHAFEPSIEKAFRILYEIDQQPGCILYNLHFSKKEKLQCCIPVANEI